MRVTPASTKRYCRSSFGLLFALLCLASHLQAQSTPAYPLMPNGIAYDAAGNLYFADTNRHQVYESSLGGVLSIVAGSGVQGFSGDGGPATSAQLNSPQGVAVGPDGTLYIADTENQRIRAVIGGQISTFAGSGVAGFSGDGSSAILSSLNIPTALALDGTGALLVCDTANHRIRRISGGVITTIAGSGVQGYAGDGAAATTAELDTPEGVAVGPDGRVYIADSHNDRIRVVATDGTISTFAGTGTRGYSGDGASAVTAELSMPQGLILTSAGTLYFADSNNQRIRMVDTFGTITTVAGSGVQGGSVDASVAATSLLNIPRGIALSTFGSPVFADTGNQQVREVLSNGYLYLPAGLALGRLSTVALDASATSTYGQLSATATVLGAAGTPQGTAELIDSGSLVVKSPLVAGAASFLTNSLAMGSYGLSVLYQGDGVNPAATSNFVTVNIGSTTVTATASPAAIEYGQPIPTLTGTLSGVLPQDVQSVTAVFTTTATSQSMPGTYPIVATLTGAASGNYSLALSPASGSLQISQANSLTVEQPLAQSSYAGLPLVLSATISSTTTGTPTGTVNFAEGNTVVATATLAGGIASATYLSPPAGSHSIVATYLGDADYDPSSSLPVATTVGAMPDFTLAISTSAKTTQAGAVATYSIAVTAQPAPFTGVVYLSASGLPSGATATFSPPQTVPGAASATVVMSVQTLASTAGNNTLRDRNSVLVAFLMVPLALAFRRRRLGLPLVMTWLVFASLASAIGCGARTVSTEDLTQHTYTLQIKGTATNLAGTVVTHSIQTVLIVQ